MKKILVVLIIAVSTFSVDAQAEGRYITFTDSNGVEHRHELADDSTIRTHRPDGSTEAFIGYEDGALQLVGASQSDGSAGAFIGYRDGVLRIVQTIRSDGGAEALIGYEDGVLQQVETLRPDGNLEARITYEYGTIDTIQLANPFNPNRALKGIYNIASGNPVCR